jgi:hypothetical protein
MPEPSIGQARIELAVENPQPYPPEIRPGQPKPGFFTDEYWQGKKTIAGIIVFLFGGIVAGFSAAFFGTATPLGIFATGFGGTIMTGGAGLAGAGIYNQKQKSGKIPLPTLSSSAVTASIPIPQEKGTPDV